MTEQPQPSPEPGTPIDAPKDANAQYPPLTAVPSEEPTDQIATFESEGGASLPTPEPPVLVPPAPEAPTPAAPETTPPAIAAVPPTEDPIGTFEGEGGPPLPPAEAQ